MRVFDCAWSRVNFIVDGMITSHQRMGNRPRRYLGSCDVVRYMHMHGIYIRKRNSVYVNELALSSVSAHVMMLNWTTRTAYFETSLIERTCKSLKKLAKFHDSIFAVILLCMHMVGSFPHVYQLNKHCPTRIRQFSRVGLVDIDWPFGFPARSEFSIITSVTLTYNISIILWNSLRFAAFSPSLSS